ncbi:alpha/beta hydrolase, partial [bacterium]
MQIVSSGILVNYRAVNSKEAQTLLILHGWGQSSSDWQTVLDGLPKNVTGIALDLPTFGSTQALPGNPGVADYSDFVNHFITKLKLKNITLLGHSFGGQIAVDFSLRFPKQIRRLILVSPACIRQSNPGVKSQIAKVFKPLLKTLSPQIYDRIFQRIASPNYFNSTPNQREVLNTILYQDYSGKLPDITTLTSIIWGDKDITIENKSKFLAEQIPNSHLYVLYGTDHSPHLTSPQKFISLLNT